MADTWEWDPSLYSGSAEFYPRGRAAYPPGLATAFATELGLDGSGRLLDVGCGPGSLTLLLAGMFEEAVGLDADADMLGEASRQAAGIPNCRWVHRRAEELPAGLGRFRLVTFAQSFHWFDRPRVAAAVRGMVESGGCCAHVHANTHEGVEGSVPHDAITELVREYLGPVRRAGRGVLPAGTPGGEPAIYRGAGFTGPRRFVVPGWVADRTADEVVAAVFSLSSSTPSLFGGRRAEFESELRQLLHRASPDGTFTERLPEIAVDLWRP
ncbi:class I SAM-dependent methyltransferase [Amycolatopsis balhimycina DSM 5908]|uniref:Class I SAM-dependent methyltransferase n=1 Tax=Amycolatopsis balhimycina DSM 5908 TaxID=1081091 RepID=A0A428VXQ2_AMYBA|nr:class I SAM-dependent methyltransferase [Amycolatopsis balhimycina]RSM35634.1 class I SAM-dependent methyltransferase [Amycolatopsis balhimycina DSM 5908]